jgi:hypothetical protein
MDQAAVVVLVKQAEMPLQTLAEQTAEMVYKILSLEQQRTMLVVVKAEAEVTQVRLPFQHPQG